MIDLSVIIPSYNSQHTIVACLEALVPQLDAACDLIVVDSSSDATPDILKDQFPDLRVAALASRVNAGAARNLGVAKTSGYYLAFIDSDIVVTPNWVGQVRTLLPRLNSFLGLGSAIYPQNGYGPLGGALHLIEFAQYLRSPQHNWNYPSCSMVVARRLFSKAGGFPESFEMAEDLLFNWTASESGKSCFWIPAGLAVQHINRESADHFYTHLEQLGYWSARARLTADLPGSSWVRLFGGPSASLIGRLRYRRIRQRVHASAPEFVDFFDRHKDLVRSGLRSWSRGFKRGLAIADCRLRIAD